MRRFIIWLLIFAAATLCVDLAVGQFYDYLFTRSTLRINGVEHALLDADEDVVVLGNSAGSTHFDAGSLERQLGVRCTNAATSGSSLQFNLVALKGLLARHKPKAVILALNPHNFCRKGLGRSTINFYSYYGRSSEAFDSVLAELYPRRYYFLRSNLVRIDRNIVRHFAYKTGAITYPYEKGFEPIPHPRRHPSPTYNPHQYIPLPECRAHMEEFARLCHEAGVKLIVALTPHTFITADYSHITSMLHDIASRYEFIVWDDSLHPSFNSDMNLFFDEDHLNIDGARKYTDTVALRLRTIIA